MKVIVIQGQGLDVRGKTQIDIFGPETLAEINAKIEAVAAGLDIKVEIFQSNDEEAVVAYLAAIDQGSTAALLINPGGFTVADGALPGALKNLNFPVYEIHGSNPSSRGVVSKVQPVCQGSICGFGYDGYGLALSAIKGFAS